MNLYVISDVHLGSAECDEELFQHNLQAIKEDPLARVILNGDLLQNDLRGSTGDIYKQKYPPSKQKRIMRQYLEPIAEKILGMIGGNHDEFRTQEDATPILDIAEWLDVPYLEGEGLFKIPVGARPNGKPYPYTVYCTHGSSGGRTMGAVTNALHRLGDIVLADVYCIGHTHKPLVFPDSYYVPDLRNNKVHKKIRYYVNTGSYQKRGMYPIIKNMRPVVLMTPKIVLSGTERKVNVIL